VDALGRALRQPGREFPPTAPNGPPVQAGDLRQQRVAAPAKALGFEGHEPAALLLIQAADQQVDVLVKLVAAAEASAARDAAAEGADTTLLPKLVQRLADLGRIRDDLEHLTQACTDAALVRQGQRHRRELDAARRHAETLERTREELRAAHEQVMARLEGELATLREQLEQGRVATDAARAELQAAMAESATQAALAAKAEERARLAEARRDQAIVEAGWLAGELERLRDELSMAQDAVRAMPSVAALPKAKPRGGRKRAAAPGDPPES
jgi:hypothetical protein